MCFVQQAVRQPSPEEASPRASPRSSPRKFAANPTVPAGAAATSAPSNNLRQPKDILKNLFDSSAKDMSSFRVLYNLEVWCD